ncbi:MAG: hypothetical protein ACLFWM_13715 [Actinomycetota bacterium]
MDSEDPVQVEPEEGPDPPPFVPGGWIVPAGIAAVAVVVVLASSSLGNGRNPTATTDSPTLPTVPSSTVPPTLPRGEVVERSMIWEPAEGLGTAIHLGGAHAYDEALWLAGSTAEGVTVWSTDPEATRPWEAVASFEGTSGWQVLDLEATGDGMVVVAGQIRGPAGEGALYASPDGQQWREYRLPGSDPRSSAVPTDVVSTGSGIAVHGYAVSPRITPELLAALPEGVRHLVEEGLAWVDTSGETIRVLVPPALEVDRIPSGRIPDVPPGSRQTTMLWTGEDPATLVPEASEPAAQRMVVDDDGTLLGLVGNRLAVSQDGRSWELRPPPMAGMRGFVPWHEGIVLVDGEGMPRYWTADGGETVSVVPAGLMGDSTQVVPPLAAGEWGLAMVRRDSWRSADTRDSALVAETERGELYVGVWASHLELVRDGNTVWRANAGDVHAELTREGELRLGPANESVTVDVGDWAAALARNTRRPAYSTGVIHTPDGQEWSTATWEEISGAEEVADLSLLTAGSRLLAIDQTTYPLPGVHRVMVGRVPDR